MRPHPIYPTFPILAGAISRGKNTPIIIGLTFPSRPTVLLCWRTQVWRYSSGTAWRAVTLNNRAFGRTNNIKAESVDHSGGTNRCCYSRNSGTHLPALKYGATRTKANNRARRWHRRAQYFSMRLHPMLHPAYGNTAHPHCDMCQGTQGPRPHTS